MREILSDLLAALDRRRDLVYCCLVETRGSTPQKAGASMLVFADGSQRGTLGGGCVEAEVKQRALRVLNNGGRAELLTFSLDSNYGWDDGLICGGRMCVLADPIATSSETPSAAYYRRYGELIDAGKGCTEAVVVAESAGLPLAARYLFDDAGQMQAQLAESQPTEAVLQNLMPLAKRPEPSVKQGVSYLPCLPRITLLIVGGGHVGLAVAQLAASVDFDVWVLDDREPFVNAERFPMAERRIAGDIGASLKELIKTDIRPSTYALIVTRGHNHDEEALYHLAPTAAGYVGMIGSKRKIKLIYEDLLARGISEETLARVHAPLGFDIGARTVPEIAVSIVAELIACRNQGTTSPSPRVPIRPGTVKS